MTKKWEKYDNHMKTDENIRKHTKTWPTPGFWETLWKHYENIWKHKKTYENMTDPRILRNNVKTLWKHNENDLKCVKICENVSKEKEKKKKMTKIGKHNRAEETDKKREKKK